MTTQRDGVRLRVLYVHHAAVFGGASRSLLELIAAFPPGHVAAHAVVPSGIVAEMLRSAGVEVVEARGIAQFDCTRYGHYRAFRWLILLREAFYLPFTVLALLRARRRWRHVDIVHLNDTTQIFCLLLARRLFDAPVVVHARALLAGDLTPRRTRWLERLLVRHADAVVAIDDNVKATLPAGICSHVIRNGYAPGLGPRESPPPIIARLSPHTLKVAMVGSLSAMKGAYEFVEAARILLAKGLKIDFILVGEDIRPLKGIRGWLLRRLGFGRPVRHELANTIAAHGLAEHVHLIGFTRAIKGIYDAIDVLCFPSHLDAPGRPVFEAAFSGVPSIVAAKRPHPDTLVPGETGLCVPARDALALAVAIERLYSDRSLLAHMGEAARTLAQKNFDIRTNATEMIMLYRQLVTSNRDGAQG